MAERSYDAIADWYDEFVQQQPIYTEVVLPNLLNLAGDVQGQRVCDVACGQGLATRELAKAGASVTGIDISEPLLERARAYERSEPLGIHYVLDDGQTLATQPDGSFDGTTCCMGLINIPDLRASFGSIHRILAPGGWFVFCITHPCFDSPNAEWLERDGRVSRVIHTYFDEGFWQSDNPERLRGKVGDWHRTLSTYLNTLIDAGFAIERMMEPRITGRSAEKRPGRDAFPNLLLVRARAA